MFLAVSFGFKVQVLRPTEFRMHRPERQIREMLAGLLLRTDLASTTVMVTPHLEPRVRSSRLHSELSIVYMYIYSHRQQNPRRGASHLPQEHSLGFRVSGLALGLGSVWIVFNYPLVVALAVMRRQQMWGAGLGQ